jgi:hypothetical protein
MAIHALATTRSPPTPLLAKYTNCVSKTKTPNEILDALDDFASHLLPIDVLGAGQMPLLTSDWPSIQLGRDARVGPLKAIRIRRSLARALRRSSNE